MKINKHLFLLLLIVCPFIARSQQNLEKNYNLLNAAYEGRTDSVMHLMLDSADVNFQNEEGNTALMYAAENGYDEIVKILLYNKAKPNLVPNSGRTALISAAIHNHLEIVYTLLLYGANLNARDEFGATALTYSCGYNLYDMAEYLVNYAQLNLKTYDSTSALMCAAYFGNPDVTGLLLKNNADANATDEKGFNAVSIAIQDNDFGLLDSLIKYKTTISTGLHFKQKVNAVDYARILNRRYMVTALKKAGCRGSFWPFYNRITVSYNAATFNTKDIFMGVGIGILDSKYNSSFEFGFNKRLAKKWILEQQPDNSYYQLWEKRQFVYLSFEKLFSFRSQNIKLRHGIFIRLKGLCSFGSFDALDSKPKTIFAFAPGLGYGLISKNFFVKAAYEYANIDPLEDQMHWITISAGFTINLYKHKLIKKIKWM